LSLPGSPLQAISGERNDTITVTYDRNVSPWGVSDYNNYDISTGGNSLDLSTATFVFDGDDTIVITLDGSSADSLQAASTYDFSVDDLQSEQGITMTAPSTSLGVAVVGDTVTPPSVGATDVRIDRSNPNAVLVFSTEALDTTTAENEALWDYNSGTTPTLATLVDPTTVRLTLPSTPTGGSTLDFDLTDLAGNNSGALTRTVQSSESSAPALVSVSGISVPGEGGDYVSVVFNEPVDNSTGLSSSNFAVSNGGSSVAITSIGAWHDSTAQSVNFYLASGEEFDAALSLNVTVSNISDHSGNVMPAPVVLGGSITGDTTTPPGVVSAFVNYHEDSFGLLVDVLFDEAPDETFITNPFSWSVTSGSGQVVLGVVQIDEDEYRVALSAALGSGQELEIATGMPDLAGNVTVSATTVTVSE